MSESRLEFMVRTQGARAFFESLPSDVRKVLPYLWRWNARPEQMAPVGDWTTWLILAGRGFGKTRAGGEHAITKAKLMPGSRGFLAGRTAADVRDVMIEGESGIIAKSPPNFRPKYYPAKRLLIWPNDARAFTFSSEVGGSGRGPQFHWGWGDELAAWYDWELWDNLQLGLRLGNVPQCWITTTPRPIRAIRELLADPTTRITRGSTYDNAANLARVFLEKIVRKYEGTRLGRQELLAEVLDDIVGALWRRAQLEALQTRVVPELERIVIAVDPAMTATETSDMTGIVVAGLGVDGLVYVIEDLSCVMSPAGWANRVVDAFYRYRADLIVGEVNQGGELIETMLRAINRVVPFKAVYAKRGKFTRAEPVAGLYEQKRVRHLIVPMKVDEHGVWRMDTSPVRALQQKRGPVADLEDQMVQLSPNGRAMMEDPETGKQRDVSPDRVDALVYAATELVLEHDPIWHH